MKSDVGAAVPDCQTKSPGVISERTILWAVLGASGLASLAVAVLPMYFSGVLPAADAVTSGGPANFIVHARPIVRVIQDLSAALTVGLLLLCATALPSADGNKETSGYAQRTALQWAWLASSVWLGTSTLSLVLITSDMAGQSVISSGFLSVLVHFATELEVGQTLLLSLLAVFALNLILPAIRSTTGAGMLLAVAGMGIIPLAFAGHSAGDGDHGNGVNLLVVHLIGACVWIGGFMAVLLLTSRLGMDTAKVFRRYSTLAAWSFGAVALSGFLGFINAALQGGSLAELFTPFGVLLLTKTGILVLLGAAGWHQRRRILPRLEQDPKNRRAMTEFGVSEAALMILTVGVSVGLAASPHPDSRDVIAELDVRGSLLGFPFPEELTLANLLAMWHPDWVAGLLAVVAAGAYLAAVAKLRRRGDDWSIPRTLAFLAGCMLLIWLTSGGPAVYGRTSFSGHMIQHMGLMMYAPVLLVLGAPVLLLLRSTRPRTDGSYGLREWVLWLFRSRYSHFLTRPPVAGVIFAGSMVAFYYSPFFDLALSTHAGHMLMCIHFLLTGYLFAWVLIGIDPGPGRSPYPFRLIMLLATMAFHAFFGLSLMHGTEILAPQWWANLQLTDQAALLTDQQRGGAIAWGIGEIPTLLLALGVAVAWRRDDERRAAREDRAADNNGDAALLAYNKRLSELQNRLSERETRKNYPIR